MRHEDRKYVVFLFHCLFPRLPFFLGNNSRTLNSNSHNFCILTSRLHMKNNAIIKHSETPPLIIWNFVRQLSGVISCLEPMVDQTINASAMGNLPRRYSFLPFRFLGNAMASKLLRMAWKYFSTWFAYIARAPTIVPEPPIPQTIGPESMSPFPAVPFGYSRMPYNPNRSSRNNVL